jgi:transposase
MKKEKIIVTLTAEEVTALQKVVRSGTHKSRTIMRARILLLSNQGKKNVQIMEQTGCSRVTVTEVRKRYKKRGVAAITDAPRPGQPKKITAEHEAFVIATACTDAPPGHAHWTLGALKEKLIEAYVDLESVSPEWIRQMLIRAELKPWREKNVVRAEAYA